MTCSVTVVNIGQGLPSIPQHQRTNRLVILFHDCALTLTDATLTVCNQFSPLLSADQCFILNFAIDAHNHDTSSPFAEQLQAL